VQGLAGTEQTTVVGLVVETIFAITGQIFMPMCAHAAFDLTALAILYWNLETKWRTSSTDSLGQYSPVPTLSLPKGSSLHQPATSTDAFLRRIVALLIIGRAQKPTLRTNPNVT
jgi:hypothetical protein